jgi:gluconolactonase
MGTTPRRLTYGYALVEAPRTHTDGLLYYTDVIGGGVHRIGPDAAPEVVLPDRPNVGGLAPHSAGGLVMSGAAVIHWTPEGTRDLLRRDDVVFWNDLHVAPDGSVYVGSICSPTDDLRAPRVPGSCWRIGVDGTVTELYGDVGLSNGIGFSPDGSTLYHVDSTGKGFWTHDVAADGSVSNPRFIRPGAFRKGIPDGMCVDEEGLLWVAHVQGGRVVRLAPDGRLVDQIEVPARVVTSVGFGGPDWSTMYIVTADSTDDPALGGSIFAVEPGVRGVPVPLARV